ncbi:hypothetical protein EDI_312860 [Entamoeba dispar SAW760]|uniref:Uncharacterized protein n=1 Tax=Entamoeba dispar (strain ATCC PRA-260 / SAW760) TaxID=370354 RepID=B0ELM3_ENTDS|nr:uncharacterized protein EDI_312860 [Entamoeba dispar SAW760]EDR24554.1 hypothetical protein EDI_312860 [Entamoeba dispar SAW760]|eukprot:EDR24554.1 hypothetical protein EDI_312860 [Entamoeba dispar SAW760]
MERFHFNPIPLNEYSRKLFPNIETFHIYNKYNEIFKDGKIFKYVIWHDINIGINTIEVKSIGDEYFMFCYGMKEINIPSLISEI